MPYTFDFEQLPLRVIIAHRHEREMEKEMKKEMEKGKEVQVQMREERPQDPEPVVTKTAYEHFKVRPDRLPENCFAVYYTKKGVWLALQVGLASEVGTPELPNVEILRVERIHQN